MTDAKPTRRSFLALLGLAPVVAPTIVAAAAQPAAARFVGAATPYLGAGSRLLLCDEIDPLPWSAADVAAYRGTKLITWPEGPEKDRIDREWAEFVRMRISRTDDASDAPRATFAACPVLIDDVGGGP